MITFTSPVFRTFLLGYLAVGAGALGCSTSSAASAGNEACVALTTCCTGMGAAAAVACLNIANTNVAATCTSTLATYAEASLCGGGAGPVEAGHPVDSGLPCQLTNTCSTTMKDGGTGGDSGVQSECQMVGSCSDGQTYEECTTATAGACSASFIFSGGASFACASCSDCASALASAQSMCGAVTTMDAGHDAGNTCGTAPALHPETDAGVYCPFTPTGSVKCTAGQECCETPSTTPNGSTCQAIGTTCPVAGSISWGCNGPVDCAASSAGPVCCAAGTVALDSTCGFDRGSGFTGSHCATGCVSGEVSICAEVTDPCNSGTCTPFKTAGIVLGTCQ